MKMRTLESTIDEILNLASAHFGVERGALSAEDDLFEKLGIDSLKALDLLTPTGAALSDRASRL